MQQNSDEESSLAEFLAIALGGLSFWAILGLLAYLTLGSVWDAPLIFFLLVMAGQILVQALIYLSVLLLLIVGIFKVVAALFFEVKDHMRNVAKEA